MSKLKTFFDDLFLQFSKFFILTEKCDVFCAEVLMNKVEEISERKEINKLNKNFCILFQNLLNFFFLITQKNTGMLYLITNYMLTNHFPLDNLEERDKTGHSCIKIVNKKIEILYENKNKSHSDLDSEGEKHKCECPFLRLLFSNWRNLVGENDENGVNTNLLLSFIKNRFFKDTLVIFYFFLYKELSLNDNEKVLTNRTQFFNEDAFEFMTKESNLFENGYSLFYEYCKELLNNPKVKEPSGGYNDILLSFLDHKCQTIVMDFKYFSKPRYIKLVVAKKSIIKKFIDVGCLYHNRLKYKSIVPHPEFLNKKPSKILMETELFLLYTQGLIYLYLCKDMDAIFNIIKEIFDYFVHKILNQKSEGIEQLEENEFSFHLTLYRFFSLFINMFCLSYSIKKNKNLIDSIEYLKANMFKTKEEMQTLIDIIISDYLKFFGFIVGIKNGFFKYYEGLEDYPHFYFDNNRILKIDFILIKYLLSMSEKKLSLDYILKSSNIENTYTYFNSIFKPESKSINDSEKKDEENNEIFQFNLILEIIKTLMKNDTVILYGMLTYYEQISSMRIKKNLFDTIKKQEKIVRDIKNTLVEQIVHNFISEGNNCDGFTIHSLIEEFYNEIIGYKEFNNISSELSERRKDKNSRFPTYNLKDEFLKFLDMNYYLSPYLKSDAEKYILEFKKDQVKLYQIHFFNPSSLFFDFYIKGYENIFLNVENIEFLLKTVDSLLSKDNSNSKLINKVKSSSMPVILNYLTIFGSINSKSFIKFKIDNKDLINKLYDTLNKALENNKDNEILDKDLSENVKYTLNVINRYKLIYDDVKGELNKLNDYDNNTEYKVEEKENIKNAQEKDEDDKKNEKTKKMKEKYKDLMKNKQENFLEKIQNDKNMNKFMQNDDNKENLKPEENEDGMMCSVCRNQINFTSFDEPYGKIGIIYNDYFYKNCFRSSVKSELNKLIEKNTEEKKNVYSNIPANDIEKDLAPRLLSCGHYFHERCFKEGLNNHLFVCPICQEFENVLIPPMLKFYGQNKFLDSEKLVDILDKTKEINKFDSTQENINLKDINIQFIQLNVLNKEEVVEKIEDYNSLIDKLFLNYEGYINNIGNMLYLDTIGFHNHQQIENIQNVILSLRYLVKINYIDNNQVINYIRNGIENLIKGPNETDNVMERYKEMYYSKYIDKIIFSCVILLDYEEIKKLFLYIINNTLPYFSFWLYLRNIISENNFYSLYDEKIKEKMNLDNFKQFLNAKNKQMNEYLKLFLQKLLTIKIVTSYNKKNNIKMIHSLSLEQLFNELNLESLYKLLSKTDNNEKDINFLDLLQKSTDVLSTDNSINKEYIIKDYNSVLNSLINNVRKQKEEKYLMNAELFSQFILYEFEFIELDENALDFVENNLFKKCSICNKISKLDYICLICGKKICGDKICSLDHFEKCMNSIVLLIYQYMELCCLKFIYIKNENNVYEKRNGKKKYYPLYINSSGNTEISFTLRINSGYKLDKEKMKLIKKQLIEFNFK